MLRSIGKQSGESMESVLKYSARRSFRWKEVSRTWRSDDLGVKCKPFGDEIHYRSWLLSSIMAMYSGAVGMGARWYVADLLEQEAQLSLMDRAMRRVNWNLANCHATVQNLLIRQVLTKSMIWFSRRQCVIDNVHSTMTRSSRLPLSQVS